MQQDVIGKSALIALAGFMTSVVLVAAGTLVVSPADGEVATEQPRNVAAVALEPARAPRVPFGENATFPRAPSTAAPELVAPVAPGAARVPAGRAPVAPVAGRSELRPTRTAIPSPGAVAAGRPLGPGGAVQEAIEPFPKILPGVNAAEVEGRNLAPSPGSRPAEIAARRAAREETRVAAIPPPAVPPAASPAAPQNRVRPPAAWDGAGLPPWQRFAALPPADDDRPKIVIIIDDLGLHAGRLRRVLALPRPMTLSFLPYGEQALRLARLARQAGHELLLHLPMEPHGRNENPGPNALLVDLAPKEVARRIEWNLDRLEGYVGVNNHMGSRYTERSDKLAPLMRRLKTRGLLFVDSVTSHRSVAGDVARRHGVPTTRRDVFIDHVIERRSIEAQLRRVERLARRNGLAIALGHPHKETLRALEAWLPTLRRKGFSIAPVSAVVARRRTG